MKTKHFLVVIGIVAISLSINACSVVEELGCISNGTCDETCTDENGNTVACSSIQPDESIVETDSTLTVSKLPDDQE